MFLHDRIELIWNILNPYGLTAAFFLTALAIGLDVYAKAKPLLPLYFVSSFFFALFAAFVVGYMLHQIPNNFDPFSTTLFTFGLAASPFAFCLLIGGMSGKGFRLDMFAGTSSLVLLPLAAGLVTYFFVRIQSSLWHGVFWN
ncbi:hypothetical protein [Parasphingorhabdus sp.]|uniref:hypothetical protein n=1 Tax=Parasphingorhabdus sp. TaxID=2709688 RepID=UPI003267729A